MGAIEMPPIWFQAGDHRLKPPNTTRFYLEIPSRQTKTMFSRLSRYFSRSKRRKNKYAPLPTVPPQLPPYPSIDPPSRPLSASSGHSSSCSIEPESAPSFLQVVCNDSQPVYCMETVPLYQPSSLPPGTRKANSLYESEHQEILRQRMRVTALENEGEKARLKRRNRTVKRNWDNEEEGVGVRRWNSVQEVSRGSEMAGRNRFQSSWQERERDVYEYTSTD